MDGDTTDATPKGLIASAQRVLRVLEIVAEVGDGVTAKAVARRAHLNLSTTYQLLNTLVHEGYVVRLNNAGGYGVGYKIFELHRNLNLELSSVPNVSTVLNDMHHLAKAPLYFTIFRDTGLVIADVADSPEHPRAKEVDVGFTEATHATAYGKLLLAALTPSARDEYLQSAGMGRLTKATMTRRAELEDRLAQIQRAGVALEIEEFQPGLTCMAVPVTDSNGVVRGAVATSSPTGAFMPRRWEVERVVRLAALRVSRILSVSSTAWDTTPGATSTPPD